MPAPLKRHWEHTDEYPAGRSFGELLEWHLHWGTRPNHGKKKLKAWIAWRFAAAAYGKDTARKDYTYFDTETKNLLNWRQGLNHPKDHEVVGRIFEILFDDDEECTDWKNDLAGALTRPVKRSPLLTSTTGTPVSSGNSEPASEASPKFHALNNDQAAVVSRSVSAIASTAEQDTVVIINRLAEPFVGRSSDIEAIDNFVKARMDGGQRGLMVITAPPGIGKSALAAHWCKHVGKAENRHIVRHFCSMSNGAEQTRPEVIYEHLHKQIADLHGEPIGAARHMDALTHLLCRALPDGQQLVVWLDGVDEANGTVDCFVPYASGLEKILGERVCVIVSARAEPKITPPYLAPWLVSERAKTHRPEPYALAKLSLTNVEELVERLFATNRLSAPKGLAPRIFKASEGGWPLFVRNMTDSAIEAIREGNHIDVGKFPESLQDYVEVEIKRLATLTDWRDLHQIFIFLTIAKQAVSRTDLEIILGKEIFPETFPSQLTRWLNVVEVRGGRTNHMLSFAHPLLAKTFGQQLEDRQKTAEKAFVESIMPLLYEEWPQYASRYLLRHLLELGRIDDALGELTNIEFITARFAALGTDDCLTAMKSDWMAWYGIDQREKKSTTEAIHHPIRHLRFWNNYSDQLSQAAAEGFDKNWLQMIHDVGFTDLPAGAGLVKPKPQILPESLARLSGHTGSVYGAFALPDNVGFLTWGDDGTLRLWNTAGEAVRILRGHERAIKGVLLLPHDRGFLSWSDDATLRLWDAVGEEGIILRDHDVSGALSLPDDAGFLTWGNDGTLRLWSASGKAMAVMDGHEGPVMGALLLPNDRGFLSWGDDGTLRLWGMTGKAGAMIRAHKGWVGGVLPLPDNSGFLSWSSDNTLHLWPSPSRAGRTLYGHENTVRRALLLPHSGGFLSWGDDYTLRMWDMADDRSRILPGHKEAVHGALLLPNGEGFLSWGYDGTLRMWDTAGEAGAVMRGHESWVDGALLLPDNTGFLSWGHDGTLRLWDAAGKASAVMRGHASPIHGALLLRGGASFLSWDEGGSLRLWDARGEAGAVMRDYEDEIEGALLLSNGAGFLSWSNNHTFRLWDTADQPGTALRGYEGTISGALILSDDKGFLSWSDDGTLHLWSAPDYGIRMLSGHKGSVIGALILPDGAGFLSWSADCTLRLWDATGETITVLSGHESWVTGALFLPNDRGLLSWGCDCTLRLWNAVGEVRTVMNGHEDWVSGALLLPDDTGFLSWSEDGTLRFWDIAGEAGRLLCGHKGEVDGALVLPDGTGFLSWSRDCTLRLWYTTGEADRVLHGHEKPVRGALALADGAGFLSWARDNTIRLWDVEGKAFEVLYCGQHLINKVILLPNGEGFLSWNGHGTLLIFDWSGQHRNLWISPRGEITHVECCAKPDHYLVVFGGSVGIVHLPFS